MYYGNAGGIRVSKSSDVKISKSSGLILLSQLINKVKFRTVRLASFPFQLPKVILSQRTMTNIDELFKAGFNTVSSR